jgi:hypothetical protein
MEDFKSIDEVNIGDFVIDTYNEFNNPDFKFIREQCYSPEKDLVKVIDKTITSVCVAVNKFPLRIRKENGGVTKPVGSNQWYKFKREHDYEIGFPYRFKKQK